MFNVMLSFDRTKSLSNVFQTSSAWKSIVGVTCYTSNFCHFCVGFEQLQANSLSYSQIWVDSKTLTPAACLEFYQFIKS
jgi:hypothetical protein